MLLITSLGLTADLIGDHIESGALIYGLMSLTDKISNGLAVLLIQDKIPCLPIYGDFIQLTPTNITEVTTENPCTQPPIPITTFDTSDPNEHNPCFQFYKIVLTIATSSTSLFGAVFVILLFTMKYFRKKNKTQEKIENAYI